MTSVTMGTGIPTTLLLNLPYPTIVRRLRPLAAFFLILDTLLFFIFISVFIVRYIRHPGIMRLTIGHPVQVRIGSLPISPLQGVLS